MKTSIDYGLMLVFLACLFACCACEEEAKNEKFLLRGGASSTIEKSLLDSVPTIGNTLSLNQNNEKVNSILAEGKAVTIRDVTKNLRDDGKNLEKFLDGLTNNIYEEDEDMAGNNHAIDLIHNTLSTERELPFFLAFFAHPVTVAVIAASAGAAVTWLLSDNDDPPPSNEINSVTVTTNDGTIYSNCVVHKDPGPSGGSSISKVTIIDDEGTTIHAEIPSGSTMAITSPEGETYKIASIPGYVDSTVNTGGPIGHDDPHLQTWKGRGYGYHDQCDLVYTTCPKFDDNKGLHLHLRTEFVLPRKWSTISSIALQIGDNVLEVQNNGTYFLDRERYDADFLQDDETHLSGHKLSHTTTVQPHVTSSIFTVELVDDVSLEIMTRQINEGRNSISFKISGVYQYRMNGGNSFSDCGGLSSTWDHPTGGELLIGRSGKAYRPEDAADFGPEWQVDLTKGDPMLFYENIGQHLPDQKCINSPLHAKDQRHLKELHAAEGGALARQAKEACSHLSGGGDLFDACFFDVLVTGDVTFAQEPWYNGE